MILKSIYIQHTVFCKHSIWNAQHTQLYRHAEVIIVFSSDCHCHWTIDCKWTCYTSRYTSYLFCDFTWLVWVIYLVNDILLYSMHECYKQEHMPLPVVLPSLFHGAWIIINKWSIQWSLCPWQIDDGQHNVLDLRHIFPFSEASLVCCEIGLHIHTHLFCTKIH